MYSFNELIGFQPGYAFDPNGARALSEREMGYNQLCQLQGMQQAAVSSDYLRCLGQYKPFPEKPLDERFADFKVRLAAAVDRRK